MCYGLRGEKNIEKSFTLLLALPPPTEIYSDPLAMSGEPVWDTLASVPEASGILPGWVAAFSDELDKEIEVRFESIGVVGLSDWEGAGRGSAGVGKSGGGEGGAVSGGFIDPSRGEDGIVGDISTFELCEGGVEYQCHRTWQ